MPVAIRILIYACLVAYVFFYNYILFTGEPSRRRKLIFCDRGRFTCPLFHVGAVLRYWSDKTDPTMTIGLDRH